MRVVEVFSDSTGPTACTEFCLPIIGCTGGQDSSWVPWHMVLDSIIPTGAHSFAGRCLITCLLGGTKMMNVLHCHKVVVTPHTL